MKKRITQTYKDFIFSLSARNSFIFIFFYKYFFKPKKGCLGYFYNEISKNLGKVYVIQIGANDGINLDPIHKFIKRDKWKGVLVEPQPDVFRYKLFPLYMRDSGVYMENVAISDSISLMDMHKISFSRERWATGLTTFHKPTLQAKVDNGAIDATAKRRRVKVPAHKEDYIDTVKVEAKTFEFIRAKYQVKEVDVLQIDTEGFDFEVIKLYDLSQNKPKVIVFESRHLGASEFAEAQKYFQDNNFTMKRVEGDSVAVRNDYAFGLHIMEYI